VQINAAANGFGITFDLLFSYMQNVPKGIKIGLLFGLGLVVLINIAVFISIFRQPKCAVFPEKRSVGFKEEKLGRPSFVGSTVVRGLDYLMGSAPARSN